MDINDILTLCRAGFTAEQIGKMCGPAQAAPAPTAPAAPEPAPAPAPQGDPEPAPAAPAPDGFADKILAAISGLKETIVASNIAASNQDPPKADTTESIFSALIGGNK